MVIELMRQFYTEERCFRITGEDGKQDFVTFNNVGLQPQPQGQAFGIDLGNRMPIFDTDVRPAKKSAYSKEAQNNMALSFYSAGFFAPANADAAIACMNMMDFDGKEKTLEQIKQNQTLLQMVMQLQQQVAQMAMIIDAQNGTDVTGQAVGQAQQTAQQQEESAKAQGRSGAAGTSSKGSLTSQAASAARNSTSPR